MNLNLSKIKSYLGLTERAGGLIIGTDNILMSKNVKLILVSAELSMVAINKLDSYAKKNGIVIYKLLTEQFFEVCSKPGVKAVGISNKNLAEAIIKQLFAN